MTSQAEAERMGEYVKFTGFIERDLQTYVTGLLFESIQKQEIPLSPVELDGKPLSPFALTINALPNRVRLEVMNSLKKRVGEKGAPTQADLDELQQLLDMAADPIMKMFDGMSLLIKRKVWRHLKGWEQKGLTRNQALLCFVPHLTTEESQLIFDYMKKESLPPSPLDMGLSPNDMKLSWEKQLVALQQEQNEIQKVCLFLRIFQTEKFIIKELGIIIKYSMRTGPPLPLLRKG